MQDVAFKNIDSFLNYLPNDELKITNFLRKIVLECMPHANEKLSWNIPSYTINKSVCFIWPASVKWGKKETYIGVRFGFMHGNLLNPKNNYFDLGNRKMVRYRDFKGIKEVDVDILKATIYEAMFVDEQFSKKKRRI
ncbi:MAG: hypothetical protein RI955_262 [Bacteroidota bacterium]|jgi:uncharacterized protein YdhG (YjbR/CyaY superfamily)